MNKKLLLKGQLNVRLCRTFGQYFDDVDEDFEVLYHIFFIYFHQSFSLESCKLN